MNVMEKTRTKIMSEIARKLWAGEDEKAAEHALRFNIADDVFGALQAAVQNAKRDAESLAKMRDEKAVATDRKKADAERERLKQEREKFEAAHEPKEQAVRGTLAALANEEHEREQVADRLIKSGRNPTLLPLLPPFVGERLALEEKRAEADRNRCERVKRLDGAKRRLAEIRNEKLELTERGNREMCDTGLLEDTGAFKAAIKRLSEHEAAAQAEVDGIEAEFASIG